MFSSAAVFHMAWAHKNLYRRHRLACLSWLAKHGMSCAWTDLVECPTNQTFWLTLRLLHGPDAHIKFDRAHEMYTKGVGRDSLGLFPSTLFRCTIANSVAQQKNPSGWKWVAGEDRGGASINRKFSVMLVVWPRSRICS